MDEYSQVACPHCGSREFRVYRNKALPEKGMVWCARCEGIVSFRAELVEDCNDNQ